MILSEDRRMDELFDNILNSKDRESEKRPYDVAAEENDSKRPHTDDESLGRMT